MPDNFKIILEYIKDLSVETADAETLIYVKDNILKYQMNIGIKKKIGIRPNIALENITCPTSYS